MPELVLTTHEHGAYATEGPFGCGWGEDFVVLPAFVCGGSWLWDSFPYGLFDSSGVQGER